MKLPFSEGGGHGWWGVCVARKARPLLAPPNRHSGLVQATQLVEMLLAHCFTSSKSVIVAMVTKVAILTYMDPNTTDIHLYFSLWNLYIAII